MRYATKLKAGFFPFLLLIGAGLVVIQKSFERRLPEALLFMEHVAGIRFPDEITDVAVENPTEYCVSGRLTLPPADAEAFTKKLKLSADTQFGVNFSYGVNKELFANRENTRSWLGSHGRTATQTWEFAYDPKTRRFWFVLKFPDWSGDLPAGVIESNDKQ